MKTRFFLFVLLFLPSVVLAGDNDRNKIPDKGNWMLELNMNPFGDDKVFSLEGLKVRYWVNDRFTVRLGIDYGIRKNSISDSDWGEERYQPRFNEKSSLFSIKPGFEYRILKNSKISPYAGLEIAYRKLSSSAEYIKYDFYSTGEPKNIYKTKIIGSWYEETTEYVSGFGNIITHTDYPNRAFSAFGTNLLLGSDFYFIRNFYFGFELGLGFDFMKYSQVKKEYSYYAPSSSEMGYYSNTTIYPANRNIKFSLYTTGLIRIGVWF